MPKVSSRSEERETKRSQLKMVGKNHDLKKIKNQMF